MARRASDGPLAGRVCVVTGPTSGIGKEVARGLDALGAIVVLVCRNPEKGEAVRREIAGAGGSDGATVMALDLSSQASIRSFAGRFREAFPELHILVNNAAIFTRRRRLTSEGFELQFAVNYLGPFLLTNLLLPAIRAAGSSRIVNVASNAHYGGHIDFANLQGERRYRGFRAYNNSKLALVLFTYELARRLQGTGATVNAVHPGVIRTNLGRGEYPVIAEFFRLFFRGPRKGAETPLYVATAPQLNGVTGKYFTKSRSVRSAEDTYDVALAKRLWDATAPLVGLDEGRGEPAASA